MARQRILQDKKDDLIKDLEETTLSFEKLWERYGILRNKNQDVSKYQLELTLQRRRNK